jgi:hypothetical protein
VQGNSEHPVLMQLDVKDYDSSGKFPVGYIQTSAADLEDEVGLTFVDEDDDLGEFKWSIIKVESSIYALISRENQIDKLQIYAQPSEVNLVQLADALRLQIGMIVPSKVMNSFG